MKTTFGRLQEGDLFKMNGRPGTFRVIVRDSDRIGYWHKPGCFRNVRPDEGQWGMIVKKVT